MLMSCYFAISVLQEQFIMSSIGVRFELMGDDSGNLTRCFIFVLSMAWTVTPFIGIAIDRCGFIAVSSFTSTVFLIVNILFSTSSYALQVVACVMYATAHVSSWGIFFSFNGAVFGFVNFGKLVGGAIFAAATFSLLQLPLLDLTIGYLQGDFTFVNGLFMAISILMYPLIAGLAVQLRKPHHHAGPVAARTSSTSAGGIDAAGGKVSNGEGGCDARAEPESSSDLRVTAGDTVCGSDRSRATCLQFGYIPSASAVDDPSSTTDAGQPPRLLWGCFQACLEGHVRQLAPLFGRSDGGKGRSDRGSGSMGVGPARCQQQILEHLAIESTAVSS